MRPTPHEVAAIKAAAREAFGETAVVRLFGSRVDDTKRGGDIDLHVEVDAAAPPRATIVFRRELWKRLDEMPVDVVLARHGEPPSWVDDAARRSGIRL